MKIVRILEVNKRKNDLLYQKNHDIFGLFNIEKRNYSDFTNLQTNP